MLNKIKQQYKRIQISRYKANGQQPWSRGYGVYKWEQIKAALDDQALITLFREGQALPEKYGWALDERIIEYPWLFSRLGAKPARMLDAGSALNFRALITPLQSIGRKLTIVTLAPEKIAFWQQGVSYHYEDLRLLPFKDAWFNEITCLSTLEHVGFDNTAYGDDASTASGRFSDAALELWRVLKPAGKLYISVPYGQPQDLYWGGKLFSRQFDAVLLAQLEDCFVNGHIQKTFYRYTPQGWQLSTQEMCNTAMYFNIHETPFAAADHAAAARAVACLEITKP